MNLGATIKQAAAAYSQLATVLRSLEDCPPFFTVRAEGDGYHIIWYDPERQSEIKKWFKNRRAKPYSLNHFGWHVETKDADLALLAKLTWGGAL